MTEQHMECTMAEVKGLNLEIRGLMKLARNNFLCMSTSGAFSLLAAPTQIQEPEAVSPTPAPQVPRTLSVEEDPMDEEPTSTPAPTAEEATIPAPDDTTVMP